MTLDTACDIAQCLSSRVRLRILLLLAFSSEPQTYKLISQQLDHDPKNVAYHLKELYDNDLVVKEDRGRMTFYAINQRGINEFTQFIVGGVGSDGLTSGLSDAQTEEDSNDPPTTA